MCSRSGSATLSPTLIEVSSAPPWNDTPICRRTASISRSLALRDVDAEQAHRAAARLVQAEQMPQQRALARTRPAHDHADLAGVHAEVDAVEDAPPPVPGFEFFDFDQGRGGSSSIQEKRENHVGDDDVADRQHDRARRRAADAFGAAADGKSGADADQARSARQTRRPWRRPARCRPASAATASA